MGEPVHYYVVGEATCGFCYSTFDRENPAMDVIRHERGYDYDEASSWHAACVEQANADETTTTTEAGE